MNKKLALIAVLFTAIVLPANATNANTYKTALFGSVDHAVEFVKGSDSAPAEVVEVTGEKPVEAPKAPVKEVKKVAPKKTLVVVATAYSSTPDQTDSTPCITATGYDVCNKNKNVIAVSRNLVHLLGYGTQVRFPELFGDKVFHIEDTMNARFVDRIDFHFDSREEARKFGVKRGVKIEVI